MKHFSLNLIKFLSITFCLLYCFSCKANSSPNINIDKSNIPTPPYNDVAEKFIRINGTKLVCSDGSDFFIKGMAFGNLVWDNKNEEPKYHHTKESYKEIKDMGFNAVRFYINYRLFEEDSNPYVYKNTGFEWLDKNIQWAKDNGIYLIVNMHVPQGGFQSNGDGQALFRNPKNQNRLIELWKVIAEYYKDCSTIIGWGLVNEPVVPYINNNSKESLQQWHNLAQKITNAIRKVDSNHILFIERAISVTDENKNYFSYDVKDSYPIIQDENIVYEFHSYDPLDFTHQHASWIPTLTETIKYPDETKCFIENTTWVEQKTILFGNTKKELSTQWKEFTHSFSANQIDFSKKNVFSPSIKPANLQSMFLLIDDIVIKETNKDGNTTILKEYTFDEKPNWYFGTDPNNPDGTVIWESNDGHNKYGCYKTSNTKSWAYLTSPDQFPIKEDCTYTISVWAKMQNSELNNSYAEFGFDIYYAELVANFSKDYIQQIIKKYINCLTEFNKPIFVGEFGCIRNCFDGNGGLEYVKDSLEVFRDYTAGFSYHTYHEWNFGLHYTNPGWQLPNEEEVNTELKEFFTEILPSF
jgi:endoglucanase